MNQQFKSGDWVKQVKENYSDYLICFKVKSIVDDTTYIVESNVFDIDAIQNTDSQFELWTPKPNELCLFWNHDMRYPIIAKLDYIYIDEFSDITMYNSDIPYIESTYTDCIEYSNIQSFTHCEPFIGQLLINLKVNKCNQILN